MLVIGRQFCKLHHACVPEERSPSHMETQFTSMGKAGPNLQKVLELAKWKK